MLMSLNELNSTNCYSKLILNLVIHMHSTSLSVLQSFASCLSSDQWCSEGQAWPGTCLAKAPCSSCSCHAISCEAPVSARLMD